MLIVPGTVPGTVQDSAGYSILQEITLYYWITRIFPDAAAR